MSYYKTWMDKSEDATNRQEYIEYINRYYALEKVAYDKILSAYPDNAELLSGTAAEMAKLFGIRVYTIGVGTRGTAPYPVQTPFGGIQYQQIQVTINEPLLQQIADETGGKYFRATSNEKLQQIYEEIAQLERSKIEINEFTRVHEEFLPFVMLGLALLLLGFILKNTVFRTLTD